MGISCPATSQFAEKDSLLRIINSSSPDSLRSDALNEFAFYMFDYNVDSSIILAKEAERIALQSNNKRQEARALKNIGISFDIKGKTDSALLYFDQALLIARNNQLHPTLANIITDIANAWYAAGNYELALRHHFDALRLREEYKARKEIAQTFNNIALVYRSRRDYANAVKYNRLSLQIKQELDNKQGIVNSSINLGSCYQYMGRYDSALFYAQKVMTLAFVPQDKNEGKANYASALTGLKRLKEAKEVFTSLLPDLDREEEQSAYVSCLQGLGAIALLQGEVDTAIAFFGKGVIYARQYNDREFVASFYKQLANAYSQKNDFSNAYRFNLAEQSLRDSLLNEENLRQINEMNAVYEKDRQEQQIGELTSQVSVSEQNAIRNRQQRNLFLLATVFLLALASVILYAFYNNRRKNKLLSQQKKLIEQSLRDKEVLMREIHHRVKNNLQVVTSLLNLQSHYIDDEKAYSAVQAGRNRVQSMALIHQFLYRDAGNLTTLRIRDYIKELLSYIEDSNHHSEMKVQISQQVDDLELDIDTVVPLGLIINELVSNAYKYAFNGKESGTIMVSLTQTPDFSNILLRVSDDGIGMKEDLTDKKNYSFGYRMIKAFAEKLEAKLSVESVNGTTVSLLIPAININNHE